MPLWWIKDLSQVGLTSTCQRNYQLDAPRISTGLFTGDMSRTDINFKKNFNRLLLQRIGHMAVEIILESLAGQNVDHARAILDILAPSLEEVHAGSEWFKVLQEACDEKGSILLISQSYLPIEALDDHKVRKPHSGNRFSICFNTGYITRAGHL